MGAVCPLATFWVIILLVNVQSVCTKASDHDAIATYVGDGHRRTVAYTHSNNGPRSRVHNRAYRIGRGPIALALRNKHPRDLGTPLNRPSKDTEDLLLTKDLLQLKETDPVHALLEYVKRARGLHGNCTGSLTLDAFNYDFPNSSYERFRAQAQGIVKTANVLNNLFRVWDAETSSLYNDAFYYSLVRAIVESDEVIYGSSIAFDREQYNGNDFCPYVHRNKTSSKIIVKDLALVSKRKYNINGTRGYEWFWKHRDKNYSEILWKHSDICTSTNPKDEAHKRIAGLMVLSTSSLGKWTSPYYDCAGGQTWMVTYSVPFFGCTQGKQLLFKGVVAIDIDMEKMDINQCEKGDNLFANTHKCRPTTVCETVPGKGFHPGSYKCVCSPEHYFPLKSSSGYYNGSSVEEAYRRHLLNHSDLYMQNFQCLPCVEGCDSCTDGDPCMADYDVMLRGIPLGIQSFCMTISVVIGFVILKLRRKKVMKTSMWVLLEIIIGGALLLYSTVIIQYFEPSNCTCVLIPWFREVGFAIVYGGLVLKLYRVLAEFQSRKAHRVHVRDKDLLKWLLGLVLVVIGYMSAWTAVNMDHVREGDSMVEKGQTDLLHYKICKSLWWDYIIEIGEFLFLLFGVYLCYCVRSAPSDYWETKYIAFAIYVEAAASALLHIVRHFIWQTPHPDYIFILYFVRCQVTVSLTLILLLGPKLWYAHRPPEDEHFRQRAYSSSDVHDTILPESMKLQVGVSSNGDVEVAEVNLAEMDPEDIRAELKRLYTQLQIYKTKTMRKDNPHISKRRGGRKQTHRRFSLQAFHYKHRHHHSTSDHDAEVSKTPEESTNSAEGVAIQMDSSSRGEEEVRTPTVTFKPGHKSFT